jgi:hypothetical protein
MSTDYLNQELKSRNVDMGGVAAMFDAAIKGHKQHKTAELTRLATARGMGRTL